MGKLIDLSGRRFGKLEVLERAPNKGTQTYWLCKCSACGSETAIQARHLRGGHASSCGCEKARTLLCGIEGCGKPHYARGWCETHYGRWRIHGDPLGGGPFQDGRKKHPLYVTWIGVKNRCENKNNRAYRDYGARGISLYKPWSEDFWAFAADMPPKPSPEHTLERNDNSKGYSPDNCRWATRAEQARNTRRNRYLTVNGHTQLLVEWAAETGIRDSTILHRIKELGWSVEDAVTIPHRAPGRADRCKQGHPLTEANTYLRKDGYRACKECVSQRDKKRYALMKAQHA